MAEAAAREPSMEEILASIRKIIAQDDARERPVPPEPPFMRASRQQPAFEDDGAPHQLTPPDFPAFDPLPPVRPAPEAMMRPAESFSPPPVEPSIRPAEPIMRPAPEPMARFATEAGVRPPPTLASLTEEVKRQMPRPAPRPQPASRPQPQSTVASPMAQNGQPSSGMAAQRPLGDGPSGALPAAPRNAPSLAALAASALAPQPSAQPTPALGPHQMPMRAGAPTHVSSPPAAASARPDPVQSSGPSSGPSSGSSSGSSSGHANGHGSHSADQIVSPATSRMVSQSIDRLKAAVADDTSAKVEQVLRPMLKEWLDKHLPAMVERIVREEIERIARG
jgi:uncharacterized protein